MALPCVTPEVVARFAPVLHLHPGERYWPCTPEWYMSKSELRLCPWGVDAAFEAKPALSGTKVLVPLGQLDDSKLKDIMDNPEYSAQHFNLLIYMPSPEHYKGEGAEGDLDRVNMYAHVKLIEDDDKQPEAVEINYLAFYAYNGAYDICGLPCIQAGAHVGDWEHVTVRLSASSLLLQGVWFNSHGNKEGEWRSAARTPRDKGSGRPIAYVAKESHGMYPRPGLVGRIFCAANDITGSGGRVWRPKRIILLDRSLDTLPRHGTRGCAIPAAEHDTTAPRAAAAAAELPEVVFDTTSAWTRFAGYYGSAEAPAAQGWYSNSEPPVSRGCFTRLCMPMAKGVDRLPANKYKA